MKSIRLMSALALALLPVVASAQGGGRYGGMGRGRGGRSAGRDSSMRAPALTSDEIMKDSPLRALPNVFLTPHRAGHTIETLARQGQEAVEEVARFFAGEPVRRRGDAFAVAGRRANPLARSVSPWTNAMTKQTTSPSSSTR